MVDFKKRSKNKQWKKRVLWRIAARSVSACISMQVLLVCGGLIVHAALFGSRIEASANSATRLCIHSWNVCLTHSVLFRCHSLMVVPMPLMSVYRELWRHIQLQRCSRFSSLQCSCRRKGFFLKKKRLIKNRFGRIYKRSFSPNKFFNKKILRKQNRRMIMKAFFFLKKKIPKLKKKHQKVYFSKRQANQKRDHKKLGFFCEKRNKSWRHDISKKFKENNYFSRLVLRLLLYLLFFCVWALLLLSSLFFISCSEILLFFCNCFCFSRCFFFVVFFFSSSSLFFHWFLFFLNSFSILFRKKSFVFQMFYPFFTVISDLTSLSPLFSVQLFS